MSVSDVLRHKNFLGIFFLALSALLFWGLWYTPDFLENNDSAQKLQRRAETIVGELKLPERPTGAPRPVVEDRITKVKYCKTRIPLGNTCVAFGEKPVTRKVTVFKNLGPTTEEIRVWEQKAQKLEEQHQKKIDDEIEKLRKAQAEESHATFRNWVETLAPIGTFALGIGNFFLAYRDKRQSRRGDRC